MAKTIFKGSESLIFFPSNRGYKFLVQNQHSFNQFWIDLPIEKWDVTNDGDNDLCVTESVLSNPARYEADKKRGVSRSVSSVVENKFQDLASNDFTASYKFILNKFLDELTTSQYRIILKKISTQLSKSSTNGIFQFVRSLHFASAISEIPFKKISFEILDNSYQFNIVLNNRTDNEYLLLVTVPDINSSSDDVVYSLFINRELEVSNVRPIAEVIEGVKELLTSE